MTTQKKTPPPQPNRHIMALATYCGLLPFVYFVPPVVGQYVNSRFVTVALSLALIVPTMSYVILPTVRKAYGMLASSKSGDL